MIMDVHGILAFRKKLGIKQIQQVVKKSPRSVQEKTPLTTNQYLTTLDLPATISWQSLYKVDNPEKQTYNPTYS